MSEYKVLYKKVLHAKKEGLIVNTIRFIVIHETEHFWHCVPEFMRGRLNVRSNELTEIQYARKRKLVKKVGKKSKRFAFETESEAMDHLIFLKKRQLIHLVREMAFVRKFIGSDIDGVIDCVVPDSKELVADHLIFD